MTLGRRRRRQRSPGPINPMMPIDFFSPLSIPRLYPHMNTDFGRPLLGRLGRLDVQYSEVLNRRRYLNKIPYFRNLKSYIIQRGCLPPQPSFSIFDPAPARESPSSLLFSSLHICPPLFHSKVLPPLQVIGMMKEEEVGRKKLFWALAPRAKSVREGERETVTRRRENQIINPSHFCSSLSRDSLPMLPFFLNVASSSFPLLHRTPSYRIHQTNQPFSGEGEISEGGGRGKLSVADARVCCVCCAAPLRSNHHHITPPPETAGA